MICPACKVDIATRSKSGETLLRNRGLIIKSDAIVLVCPKCSGDIPLSQTMHKAVQQTAMVFFRR